MTRIYIPDDIDDEFLPQSSSSAGLSTSHIDGNTGSSETHSQTQTPSHLGTQLAFLESISTLQIVDTQVYNPHWLVYD